MKCFRIGKSIITTTLSIVILIVRRLLSFADAVQASKLSVTQKQTLTNKLMTTMGDYQATELTVAAHFGTMPKRNNRHIIYTIDTIKQGERGFEVLREIISPENVQVMAELITIKQTKVLIGYIGNDAIVAHEKVYIDIMHKDDYGYVMSDYYDLVQDVAVFLCEHFGKYLDDYLYTSKKGRAVTVKMEYYYIIKRELYRRYSVGMKNTSISAFRYVQDNRDFMETSDEETEASYDRVEKIISLMNLGEKHLIVLNARMQGISYTQIAAILHCTTASVHNFRYVMQRRYNKVIRQYAWEL